MSYIRDKSSERTGYQASAALFDKIDLQCDFVMVYGTQNNLVERISQYRAAGYKVHLMTGIAWGGYSDYFGGEYDGRDHYDEGQTDRFGNVIVHGKSSPYMVPTVAFADYITEKLKPAVDAGVEAIHVEEPEFWDRAGYSDAFKREYLLYYKEPWRPAHSSLDARYKTAKLKAYLYRRTIDRVSAAIREYAMTKYSRVLRFYVPTHSLLNYTQWKIMSPEGSLAGVEQLDGFIAQVWTGTSRVRNCFDGKFKERTFETAYLEYGVMQELVGGTGKKMWFLHDPIEDNPAYDWDDYRRNYLKTVTASLLHPAIDSFEICPWPNRVFDGVYPSNSPEAEPISTEYSTLLCGVFQALGDIPATSGSTQLRVGVLMSDTALFQRDYPDGIISGDVDNRTGTVLADSDDDEKIFESELFSGSDNKDLLLKFIKSGAFPSFYGLSLPLLKYGMPLRPVLLDNLRRCNGYLDSYNVLVLSYEFMKPEYPDINNALAAWVRNGGQLIYVGDGSDPYHRLSSWWTGKYASPAEHLFEMLGISPTAEKSSFNVGTGTVTVWKKAPAKICYSKDNAEEYRAVFKSAIALKGRRWIYSNRICEKRGAYISAAVFNESCSEEPWKIRGLFVDMFTPDFKVLTEKTLWPDENTLLYDLSAIDKEKLFIVGTTVRIYEMRDDITEINLKVRGTVGSTGCIRMRAPRYVSTAQANLLNGEEIETTCKYDLLSRTFLITFKNAADDIYITLS